MQNYYAPQYYEVNPADLNMLLMEFEKAINGSLNCHKVGTISNFYPETQTADAVIGSRAVIGQKNLNNNSSVFADYPPILNRPVIILGGGDGAITFPIKSGDECLILFNDKDMTPWYNSNSPQSPNDTERLHHLTDAIILVGLKSAKNHISDYNPDATEIRCGNTKISLYSDHIDVTCPLTDFKNTIKYSGVEGYDTSSNLVLPLIYDGDPTSSTYQQLCSISLVDLAALLSEFL